MKVLHQKCKQKNNFIFKSDVLLIVGHWLFSGTTFSIKYLFQHFSRGEAIPPFIMSYYYYPLIITLQARPRKTRPPKKGGYMTVLLRLMSRLPLTTSGIWMVVKGGRSAEQGGNHFWTQKTAGRGFGRCAQSSPFSSSSSFSLHYFFFPFTPPFSAMSGTTWVGLFYS